VFTSTLAGGTYGSLATPGRARRIITRHFLRAAYLVTLLSVVAVGRRVEVLTLIGGRVFGNPIELISESILWATEEATWVALVLVTLDVDGQWTCAGAEHRARTGGGWVGGHIATSSVGNFGA
jgi:hypothetical protein